MPRINRTDVTFTAAGHNWLARFSHEHNDEVGVSYRTPSGKTTMVRHITTCRLSYVDDLTRSVVGQSPCSLKDTYDWRKGLKRALQKALEKGRFCAFERGGLVGKHKKGCSYTTWIHNDRATLCPSCKATSREETVVGLKDEYGQIMAAFHREVLILDYPPHNVKEEALVDTAVMEGVVVTPENATPPENRAGLAYAGMD